MRLLKHYAFYPYYRKIKIGRRYAAARSLQALFFHIPKSAGITASRLLYGGHGLGHVTVDQVYCILGPLDYRAYFKATIVRDPFTRLLSAYNFLHEGGMNSSDKNFWRKHVSKYQNFEDFVLNGLEAIALDPAAIHFHPQSNFICRGNVCEMNFVGYHSNFEKDMKYICEYVGVPYHDVHENVTTTGVASDISVYSSKMVGVMKRVYRSDFENFEFE